MAATAAAAASFANQAPYLFRPPASRSFPGIVGKYMIVTGGSGNAAAAPEASSSGAAAAAAAAAVTARGAAGVAGGPRRLTDTYVLDLFTGPKWELMDDGAWGSSLMWLKPVSGDSKGLASDARRVYVYAHACALHLLPPAHLGSCPACHVRSHVTFPNRVRSVVFASVASQGACYTALHGNRLLTLKPDLHEALHELQVGWWV